ncbi:putative disease resistance protein RGA1 [Sesamum angolense]|uniref:Disease resistance protein RGA1 n=1 Tax=Sesamum angolense TaxID=2727404 RepID=A0AAE1VTA1_9LAMI|nr:putative disease resistance protein RGA1 [Sesamum angolense]
MAEIILTPLLQVIFEKLANPVLQKFADYWELEERFKKLQRILPIAQAVIQDAEARQTTDKAVRIWLTQLKDAAYKAEDLLEEFMYVHNSKLSKQYNLNFTKSRNILDDLQKTAVEGLNLRLLESKIVDEQFDMRETSSFVIGSEVYGREEEKKKILEMLLMPSGESTREHATVISIVGIPGIGKSTLAQMVYNDDLVKKCFDARIWVFVSHGFNVKRIIKAAIESVTGNQCNLTELDALQSKLWNVLQKKKYLLVLDDVWNQDQEEWDKLRLLFSAGVDGSRVLVTTRCQKVAMLIDSSAAYHLKRLCEEDSWALFKKRAFFHQGEEENNQRLLAVGKEIVRKCEGVPLAAKVLGGLMNFKREERDWLHVQHSELWDIGVYRKGIFPAMILSYLHLPLHLKHCFAFCSIFPKDYEVWREKLIHMWMAQGFILSDGGSRSLEDIGDEYFSELVWMCVFEEVNDCGGGSTRGYKMNKVFHSLARFITENELLVLEKGLGRRNLGQVRHASIVSHHGSSLVPEALHQAKHLRTLLVFSEGGIPTVPSHILSSFVYLRTLNLSGCLVNLPESIGAISFLKYLDLSHSHFPELPSTISSLCSLQVLNLFACYNLKRLPPMGKITGLSHLNISGCEALAEMPNGIKDLVHLQTLPMYIVPVNLRLMKSYNLLRKDYHKFARKQYPFGSISDLKHLNLRGELKIKCLDRLIDVEEARAANLMNKECLESLGLCWGHTGADFIMNPDLEASAARFQERKPPIPGPSEDPEPPIPTVPYLGFAWEVLECLQPHKNLKKLFIVGYPGIRFSQWTLPNLIELVLLNCQGCFQLPVLGHLPLLRSLRMEGLSSITHIGQEIYGGDVEVSFPSLQELSVRDFPLLQQWARLDGKETFPRLRKLILNNCPHLISVPHFTSLEHLELRHCTSTVLKCMEHLTLLSTLAIEGFNELLCLPGELIRNNQLLKSVRIHSCPKLHSLTSEFGGLNSLTLLSIRWCEDLPLLSKELENLVALEVLEISDCHSVTALPGNVMEGLKSLQDLSIENCSGLASVSFGLQQLSALKHLTIMYCPSLAALPDHVENLPSLSLEIRSCPGLKDLPEWLDSLTSLRAFAISDCRNLKSLPVAVRPHQTPAPDYSGLP